MELDINNTTQVYDLTSANTRLGKLCIAIADYNLVKHSRQAFEDKFKKEGSAEARYSKAVAEKKQEVETSLNYLNAALLSLGMETIKIIY